MQEVDKDTLKNLAILTDKLLNDSGDTELGYILIVFPFNTRMGEQFDFISNAREEDLHLILRHASEEIGEDHDFPEKESFEDVDNH